MMRWVPVAIVGLFLVRGVASFVSGYMIQWVAQKLIVDLRNAMFGALVRLPTAHYDAATTGAIVSKFTYNVTQVTGAATDAVNVIVKDSLAVVGPARLDAVAQLAADAARDRRRPADRLDHALLLRAACAR